MILSRHVKNNMKLYGIDEDDISAAIEKPDFTGEEGAKTTAVKKFAGRFSGYPLKVVYEESDRGIFVITAYPLKKKLWR
jgi:hypothetical protein